MPVLSWAFLTQNPQNYMTAGGIWAPLVGTFYLVCCRWPSRPPSASWPGCTLNEYAGDNWGTRIVNMAVVNLAGVPSIVHALFGVGAFVLFAGMGRSVMAASCHLAIMTLPVIISSTREALAAVPQSFREACWNMGASRWQTIRTIVLPNADQRHPDGRHPAGVACGGRNRADPLHRRGLLRRRRRDRPGVVPCPTACGIVAWPCPTTCLPSRRR
jgi:phosphate transport system permease protein